MENPKSIRWKKRYKNFHGALIQLSEAISSFNKLSVLEKEGLVQRFEYTFELAWKTMKDFLESQGEAVKYPRDTVKLAFKTGIIDNGEIWLEMLNQRNLMAHTYDEKIFNEVLSNIVNLFFPEIEKLNNYLSANLED